MSGFSCPHCGPRTVEQLEGKLDARGVVEVCAECGEEVKEMGMTCPVCGAPIVYRFQTKAVVKIAAGDDGFPMQIVSSKKKQDRTVKVICSGDKKHPISAVWNAKKFKPAVRDKILARGKEMFSVSIQY